MEFLLATSNQHKALEFSELFKGSSLVIKAAPTKLDVVEDGLSYFENARLKAEAYYKKFKVPVLSDDSGINVIAMPSELGIHSARFGGEGLSDRQRAELLLEKMKGQDFREAYFSCILCFYISPDEVLFFEGRMQGVLAHEYRGSTGFGYDPIFIPSELITQNQTVAENESWKSEHSHRASAVKMAIKFFNERNS